MPRNGSGTHSLTTTFVAETDALAEDVNTVLLDIAASLTGSIAIDGQSVMTGQLKAADGNAAAPGITFGSDLDSGFYRIGSNSFGVALSGALVATFGTGGITLATGKTLTAPGGITSQNAISTGTIQEWGGTIANIPSGNLFCDGSAVSRTTYAALFAIIGTIHGAGDGSTTFNLPNRTNRFPIGASADDAGVPKTSVTGSVTQTGGSKDAVNVSHTHTATSTVTDPGHAHGLMITAAATLGNASNILGAAGVTQTGTTERLGSTYISSKTTGVTVATSNSTEGSSGTNANLPPYYAAVYMIKT